MFGWIRRNIRKVAVFGVEVRPDILHRVVLWQLGKRRAGTVTVDGRTHQPYGLLHGGASVLLAETLGSSAGNLCVEADALCVGIEINANHLAAVREGIVTGTARALHVGRSTQVWETRIEDEDGRLVCISRLTLAVVQRRQR